MRQLLSNRANFRFTTGGPPNLGKHSMMLNGALPRMEVDPETYEVRADGRLLTCEPVNVLPLAQRYLMY